MRQPQDEIRIGFVGNPNCGKTTLFNAFTGARLKTANWPGVTVERVEGEIHVKDRNVRLIDLPGIYSLDSYTMEERVTRACVEEGQVDVLIDVADASSLERHLYLTLQLLALGRPVVLALNMMDIAARWGIEIDVLRLSELLGKIPVVPVSARERTGLTALMEEAVRAGRPGGNAANAAADPYDYIEMVIGECISDRDEPSGAHRSHRSIRKYGSQSGTDRADRVLTHPIWGIPVFLGIMALVFFFTFTAGDFLSGYFEAALDLCSGGLRRILGTAGVSDWMISLVVDGIAAGVGGVLTFLPNLFILFLALAFLEDSGYMARAAYVMNETMDMVGLSGKAFLPMLLGFGCTVPAVMAARTLENRRDRLKTILIVPFMSCSARLPIYILFSEMFFAEHALAAAYSLYVVGLTTAILAAFAANQFWGGSGGGALLMELPDYRMPNLRTVAVYVREKAGDYLSKAGTTIFLASMALWFVLNCGPGGLVSDISQSFGARIGQWMVPLLRPAGLGQWQTAVALISGISAKEVVVSSFSVLYGIGNINSAEGMGQLGEILAGMGFTGINGYALMVFCLLYTPCIAAAAAIHRETESFAWTAGMVITQLLLAWMAAVAVFQVGTWML